ncbi:MarR family winged helix-turn-helix transcriptional regulator [Paractinoplanes maris]|uniref:MarR family winged helix-turn-helix transcriptional regulator n=1 Tax=Paractinoplanes maris TaxID=1734446 RepID=UPI00202053D8|nr:MarR family transcriptional regulator [Actinoplanes maris]
MTTRFPTRDELRVWRDFIETGEAVRTEMAARLQRQGLSTGDYTVLLALSEATGQRMRSSELATAVGWERSRLSHHLGRMEKRGLIRREECLTDNRGAEAVLAPAGAEIFQAVTRPHLRDIREIFVDALTPDQLAATGEIMAALREHLAQE